ncbi:dTDP-4-dehydrorhamnose reductase [Alkalimonas collagenimarina]|uniref:dTDP-4-dehydrorhamnose reductase n=1 Tax=Alkalimonas collagenimarina TaxID=400390 RepID=A0ABT9GZ80_9GAMM|nr:dTDP-4-dehydrorhamnose reductase [Alkalimonas collagenimarina]MDP4536375.1 dTDP-4-dehydrorhamnose reductase [Alkalimonas collagenimarina]
MPNIVLLAPNGQVGFEVARAVAPLGNVSSLSRSDVDFSDIKATITKVEALDPALIINCAAWTAVDKAEAESVSCHLINAALPGALATLAKQKDAWLVHYSSDYVYPGHGTTPWQEDDVTGPLSVYGQSKLDGDIAVIEGTDKYLIFRTSWVYAARGNNFMRTMLKLAQSRDTLSVVADQIGSPTPARLIAQVTTLALQQVFTKERQKENASILSGIYHLTPKGYCSWCDFAAEIFSLASTHGMPLALKPEQLTAITTADYPTPAVRPANSRLNLNKLEHTFQVQLPSWQQQLALTFAELADKNI